MKKAIGLGLLFFLVTSILYADGIPFKGDEYDGATITLWLDKPIDPSAEKYVLNAAQQKAIFNHTGVRVQSLDLLLLEYAKGSCTCDILNIGIVYKNNRIVIPIDYIGNDAENSLSESDRTFSNLVIGEPKGIPIYKYFIIGGFALIVYLLVFKIRKMAKRGVKE